MESTITTEWRNECQALNRHDMRAKDNVIAWLRWKLYGGIEAPGHRPISGFTQTGRPIFKTAGTPFWK